MVTIVSYFLIAVAPHFFTQAIVGVTGDDVECTGKKKVVVKMLGADSGSHVFVTSDEGQVATKGVVLAFVGGEQNDGRSENHQVKVRKVVELTGDDSDDHGWLGVSLVNIKSRHDSAGEDGVVIADVIDDSPADQAGLQADDVVVSIDGQVVSSNISDLVKLVVANKPGDEIELVVLRDGNEKAFTITLGSRAESKMIEWIFNKAPLAEIEESVHTSAKFLQRGDGGEWIFKDLGDLSDIEGLPDNIKMMMPQAGTHMTKIFINDGEKRIHTTTTHDGVKISIEQESDGPITVTRTDENGDETTETYADIDELRAADEEAAALFGGVGNHFEFNIDDLDLDDLHFDFKFDFDTENLPDNVNMWKIGMGDLGDAHLQLEEVLQQIKESGALSEEALQSLPRMLMLNGMNGTPHTMHIDRAKQSFEVRPNGMIEVKVRKGDSELVELYENEEDLANRSPDLYQKYMEMRSAMD